MEETLMATYTAKLVDRTGWSEADKHGIQTKAQALFDEAFKARPMESLCHGETELWATIS
jgi:hypothetical protein